MAVEALDLERTGAGQWWWLCDPDQVEPGSHLMLSSSVQGKLLDGTCISKRACYVSKGPAEVGSELRNLRERVGRQKCVRAPHPTPLPSAPGWTSPISVQGIRSTQWLLGCGVNGWDRT